jgi:hypothetical protein
MADSSRYGEPTWGSKVLIMTFSVAVAFMAGWLVLALLLRQGDPAAAVADREVPAMPTKQPPRVAAAAAISRPLVAASQLLSPKADPIAPKADPVAQKADPMAATGTTPPPPPVDPSPPPEAPASPMTLASLPPVPVVAPPETVPAADRVAVGDIYAPVTNKMAEDDTVEAPEVIPLPPRRPHFAAVPVPRPRPQIPEDTQARAEPQTLMDFLTNGWR